MTVRKSPRSSPVKARASSAKTRDGILAAAAKVIARDGFHGMSMRDLAKHVGMAPASLYNHFPSKEELLHAIQADAFETLVTTVRTELEGVADPVARLYVFVHHHVAYVAAHRDVMSVLVHEARALPAPKRQAIRRLKERYYDVGRDIVRELVLRGCGHGGEGDPLASDAEIERATYAIFGMLNWTWGWYEPARHGGAAEVARTFHRLALCGLNTRCPHQAVQDEMGARLAGFVPVPLIAGGRTGTR